MNLKITHDIYKQLTKMRLNNFALLTFAALISVSTVYAQDDNVVPRPGDDRVVPGQPQPPVQQPVVPGVDDNGLPRPGDDRGRNSTNTTTSPSPSPTSGASSNGGQIQYGSGAMTALGVMSMFAYFLM